jgi:hypothetical protein
MRISTVRKIRFEKTIHAIRKSPRGRKPSSKRSVLNNS